jgi:hypothetical protein
VSVGILNLRGPRAGDEQGSRADRLERADRAVDAAGQDAGGCSEELLGAR